MPETGQTQHERIAAIRQILADGQTNEAFTLCLNQRTKALDQPSLFLWWDDMLRYVMSYADSRGEPLPEGLPPIPADDPALPNSIRSSAEQLGLWTSILWKQNRPSPHLRLV